MGGPRGRVAVSEQGVQCGALARPRPLALLFPTGRAPCTRCAGGKGGSRGGRISRRVGRSGEGRGCGKNRAPRRACRALGPPHSLTGSVECLTTASFRRLGAFFFGGLVFDDAAPFSTHRVSPAPRPGREPWHARPVKATSRRHIPAWSRGRQSCWVALSGERGGEPTGKKAFALALSLDLAP